MRPLNSLYQFIALLMACLIFTMSLGISIDVHYCKGHLKSFNFSGKAKSCYQLIDAESKQECTDERHEKRAEKTRNCSLQKERCCHSQLLQLLFDQDQNALSNHSVSDQQSKDFAFPFLTSLFLVIDADSFEINSTSYKPPLISRDIYVLIERFLL